MADDFIPERFDPSSPLRLTPSGKQRHPMAFSPFLGGKRVCLGKTFAENAFRVIFPIVFNSFEYQFVNPNDAILSMKMHFYDIAFKRPMIMIRLKRV